MDSEDECIRCFQHCRRDLNILCFSLPRLCPLCSRDVENTESRILPYVLPCPLVEAGRCPFCVVIKPTRGSFLSDYQNSADLHIGVTSSQGVVYEYDEEGIHIGSTRWSQCVTAPILPQMCPGHTLNWDSHLQSFSIQSLWLRQRYNEESHNCFTFVLMFLRSLGLSHIVPALHSKAAFCSEVLLKHTNKAAKYISLYRQIQMQGLVCLPTQDI